MDLVVPPPRCARFCRLPCTQCMGKHTHSYRKIWRPAPLQDDLEVLVGGEVAGPAAALRHLDDRCLQVAPRQRPATQAADPEILPCGQRLADLQADQAAIEAGRHLHLTADRKSTRLNSSP